MSGEGADDVPTDERHLVHATMRHTWGVLGCEPPVGLRITACNGVPHSRGLGSSATAIVAGVVAAQALSDADAKAGEPVAVDLALATHRECARGPPRQCVGERARWLTVSWMPDGSGLDRGDRTVTASVALHPEVEVVVLVPETQLATRTARAVLPAMVRSPPLPRVPGVLPCSCTP